jgi:hypothetical protein
MAGKAEELAHLEQRIADVRAAIEQAGHRRGWSGAVGEQERIVTLLDSTLKALEARRAALLSASH